MRRRVVPVAVALALLTPLMAGCSQGARQRLAGDVARAGAMTSRRVQAGRLAVTLRPTRIIGATQLVRQVRAGALASAAVAVDGRARRSAISGVGGTGTAVLFAPTVIYARRVTKSPSDRRQWDRLELKDLPDPQKPTFRELSEGAGPGELVAIDPVFLVDLLSGVLTGSAKVTSTLSDGSRLVDMNTSIAKAERKLRLDEATRKARKRLLTSIAVTGDIHHAQVVLRPDGSLASARFVLAEHPDKQTQLDLEAVLELAPMATGTAAPSLDLPRRETTVRVPALGTLKGAVKDQLAPQDAPRVTGVPGVTVSAGQPGEVGR
jgi:hypothetical protein